MSSISVIALKSEMYSSDGAEPDIGRKEPAMLAGRLPGTEKEEPKGNPLPIPLKSPPLLPKNAPDPAWLISAFASRAFCFKSDALSAVLNNEPYWAM